MGRPLKRFPAAALVFGRPLELPPPPKSTANLPPPPPVFPPSPYGPAPTPDDAIGRPMSEGQIRQLARMRTAECLEVLMEVANNRFESGAARVAAVKEIYDRGYGKAKQPIEVGGPGAFDQMTDAELDAYCKSEARALLIEGESIE